MKELFKPFVTWICGLFPIGLYNLSDDIDSVILNLRLLGMEQQANDIVSLHQIIEYQQHVLVVLDVAKCLIMLLSLLFLCITNHREIRDFFKWFQTKFKSFKNSFKNKLKNLKSTWLTK